MAVVDEEADNKKSKKKREKSAANKPSEDKPTQPPSVPKPIVQEVIPSAGKDTKSRKKQRRGSKSVDEYDKRNVRTIVAPIVDDNEPGGVNEADDDDFNKKNWKKRRERGNKSGYLQEFVYKDLLKGNLQQENRIWRRK